MRGAIPCPYDACGASARSSASALASLLVAGRGRPRRPARRPGPGQQGAGHGPGPPSSRPPTGSPTPRWRCTQANRLLPGGAGSDWPRPAACWPRAQAAADSRRRDARAAADRLGRGRPRATPSAALDVDHTREQIGEFASLAYMGRDVGRHERVAAGPEPGPVPGRTDLPGRTGARPARRPGREPRRPYRGAETVRTSRPCRSAPPTTRPARFADALAAARAAADAAAQAEQAGRHAHRATPGRPRDRGVGAGRHGGAAGRAAGRERPDPGRDPGPRAGPGPAR